MPFLRVVFPGERLARLSDTGEWSSDDGVILQDIQVFVGTWEGASGAEPDPLIAQALAVARGMRGVLEPIPDDWPEDPEPEGDDVVY